MPLMRFWAQDLTFFPHYADPETNTWDPLDGELTEKLNSRPYVSMSRDRASTPGIPAPAPEPLEDEEQMSLFDVHMPGVMTAPEVEAMDLGKWLLVVKQHFVHMEVCRPLFLLRVIIY